MQDAYGIFQNTQIKSDLRQLAPEHLLLPAQPYLAHLVLAGINEQLHQQAELHLPRGFSMLHLPNPCAPLELLSGLGKEVPPALCLLWALSAGVSRLKAILFLAHFASAPSLRRPKVQCLGFGSSPGIEKHSTFLAHCPETDV